jgi:protein TonB
MRKIIAFTIAIPIVMAIFMIMPMLISASTGVTPPPPLPGFVFARVDLEEQIDQDLEPDEPEPPQGTDDVPSINLPDSPTENTRPVSTYGVPGTPDGIDLGLGSITGGYGELRDCDHGPIALATPVKGYPMAAARSGLEGWVRVGLVVSADGTVRDVTVLEAEPRHGFERHALESVSRWRFRPAMAGCEAVAASLEQRIEYSLSD